MLLDRTTQRTSAERGGRSPSRPGAAWRCRSTRDPCPGTGAGSRTRLIMRSTIWVICVERGLVEHDRLVDAVEELGAEVLLERLVDLLLHPLVADGLVGLGEAEVGLAQITGAEVRGHDQHGVAEVDRTALAVGEPALLEDLQQRVEHVGVGLLDLVEQHDRERLAAHGLGELATLVVADVARGRADEAADRVLLHVLGHVEADQRRLVAEQELGERLGQLGLADTGWAEEDERAARTLRVLQAGPGTADRPAHGLDAVFLTDDALVELVLHA